MADSRRELPRVDSVLGHSTVSAALDRVSRREAKRIVTSIIDRARDGEIDPADVVDKVCESLTGRLTQLRPVLNATGVVLHTNLGRAPLSDQAVTALVAAAGYVDLEYDVTTGRRSARGRGAVEAVLEAVPLAEDALVVNNGAAALLLAITALAVGRDVIISRGELVEVGDGFRLPDLIVSTGARIREVGTTNRTTVDDYAAAIGDTTGCIAKIHPSNFRVEGFTSSASVTDLAELGPPVVVDIGSGLLRPEPALPAEPDATSALDAGAALVTCSGDKLLGGPQAGLILGRAELIERLRRHPLARALRTDKLTLAALEATLRGPLTPTSVALAATSADLHARVTALAADLFNRGVPASVEESDGAVGGGGAPGVALPGYAVGVPVSYAEPLRAGDPCIVGRIDRDRLLLDLRCIPRARDADIRAAVLGLAGLVD